jgi:hypothetical protein
MSDNPTKANKPIDPNDPDGIIESPSVNPRRIARVNERNARVPYISWLRTHLTFGKDEEEKRREQEEALKGARVGKNEDGLRRWAGTKEVRFEVSDMPTKTTAKTEEKEKKGDE